MAEPSSTSRRSVVRGVAWTVPVISAVSAAPAFAASTCVKTALQSVTWASSYTATTQTGTTTSGTNVNVTGAYTATLLGPGSINTANNMAPQTVATTRDSFVLYNNTPTTLAVDANANYQTANFVFTRPVYELTFFLDDIDATANSYLDNVAVTATPVETPASVPGALITGAGTLASPWRTTGGAGDYVAAQTVKVTYSNGQIGITSLSLRFWSSVLPATQQQHLVRIRQMQFRTCA